MTKIDHCAAIPQVALEFMNTVHCEEVLLTQTLLQALDMSDTAETIDALIEQWLAHTLTHFAREERLMEEYRFPPRVIHQQEHQRALEALRAAKQHWHSARDPIALKRYVEHNWRSWLHQHISTMDRVTANYLEQFDIQVDLDLD